MTELNAEAMTSRALELGEDPSLSIIQSFRLPARADDQPEPWFEAAIAEYATPDRRWLVKCAMGGEVVPEFTVRLDTLEEVYAYVAGMAMTLLNTPPEEDDADE